VLANNESFNVNPVPPIKLTVFPATFTLVKGNPVGELKNVFQSETLVLSPTIKFALLILSNTKVNADGSSIDLIAWVLPCKYDISPSGYPL